MTPSQNSEEKTSSHYWWLWVVLFVVVVVGGYLWWQKKEGLKQWMLPRSASPEAFQELSRFGNIFAGKILTVAPDKKSFQMEVTSFSGAPLPPKLRRKDVLMNENTKFVLRLKKNQSLYREEWAAYNKKKDNSRPAPLSYKEEKATVLDLRQDDEAEMGIVPTQGLTIHDIKFTAASVIVFR